MIIIVIKKADLSCQPFSNLKTACKHYGFIYYTLIRKEYPIDLEEYIIHKKELVKTKIKVYNKKNLKYYDKGIRVIEKNNNV